jgi:hypothetical protein
VSEQKNQQTSCDIITPEPVVGVRFQKDVAVKRKPVTPDFHSRRRMNMMMNHNPIMEFKEPLLKQKNTMKNMQYYSKFASQLSMPCETEKSTKQTEQSPPAKSIMKQSYNSLDLQSVVKSQAQYTAKRLSFME